MSSIEEIYEKLVQIYAQEYRNPSALLSYHISEFMAEGKTREEAILRLYLQKTKDETEKPLIEHDLAIEEEIGKLRKKVDAMTVPFSKGEMTEASYEKGIEEIEKSVRALKAKEKIPKTTRKEPEPPATISEPAEPSAIVTPVEEGAPAFLNRRNLAKYFVHGIAFSILFTVLAIAWVFILVVLVALGFIIGLVIGLVVLVLIVGFLNSLITTYLWFDVKQSFSNLLFHGIVLLLVLVVVNGVVVALPTWLFPGTITTVITFIIASFVDGFVAKKVAGWWREEFPEDVSETVEAKWREKSL